METFVGHDGDVLRIEPLYVFHKNQTKMNLFTLIQHLLQKYNHSFVQELKKWLGGVF